MSKPVDLSPQDLALLTNELHEVTDPHTLGIKLGIESSCVTRILQDAGDTTELKVSGILDHWLKNDLNASWATLVKALKEMNHGRLSEKLAKEYCHQGGSEPYSPEKIEDDDYMGKKAEFCDFEEKVRQEFGQFLRRANNLMKEMQVDLPDVKVTWSGYEEEMSDEACRATDIPSFLLALRRNQGPYAYGNLSALLISFCGEEGEKLVAEYEEKLKCQLRPRVTPTQRKGKKFIVKVDGRLDLKKELAFRNTLAKLFKCSPKDFILEDIHHGSTILTYIIPAEVAESIQAHIAVSVEELKNAKILQLTVEGHILWSANIEQTVTEKEMTPKRELASEGRTRSIPLPSPTLSKDPQSPLTLADTQPTLTTTTPQSLLTPAGPLPMPTATDRQHTPIITSPVTSSETSTKHSSAIKSRTLSTQRAPEHSTVAVHFPDPTTTEYLSPATCSADVDNMINVLKDHVGKDWKTVARELKFTPTDIDAIEYRERNDLKEQIHLFFNDWKMREGSGATAQKLAYAIRAARLLRSSCSPRMQQFKVGDVVKVEPKGKPWYGVIRWIGSLPDVKGSLAGIEMEEKVEGGHSGKWLGSHYFTCEDGYGLFLRTALLKPDDRFDPPTLIEGPTPKGEDAEKDKQPLSYSPQLKSAVTALSFASPNSPKEEPGFASVNDGAMASSDEMHSFECPGDVAGFIIGKDGKNLREVESQTNTKIIVHKNEQDKTVNTKVLICGKKENCKKALILIAQNVHRKIALHTATTETVMIPGHLCGKVIGRGGANVQAIQNLTGARIQIECKEGLDAFCDRDGARKCEIKGSPEQIEKAKELINMAQKGVDIARTAFIATFMVKLFQEL